MADSRQPAVSFKRTLIVDADPTVAELAQTYLTRMQLERADYAATGPAAWALLEGKTYDLIVLDWKLPGWSGLALFNRLRTQDKHQRTAVLVSSGLMSAEDTRLLDEYPSTSCLPKPYGEAAFAAAVTQLSRDSLWYSLHEAAVRSCVAKVAHDRDGALRELRALLQSNHKPLPVMLMASRAWTTAGDGRTGEALVRAALKAEPDSVPSLYELGKICVRTRRLDEAMAVLSKAQRLSPKNSNRALLAAEVALNQGDSATATSFFDRALVIDPTEARALTGRELVRQLDAHAEAEGGKVTSSLASMINIAAIAQVREGRFEAGIKRYVEALNFVFSPYERARLCFNIGVAYVRWGRDPEARSWFEKADELSGGRLEKARRRVGGAMPTSEFEPEIEQINNLDPNRLPVSTVSAPDSSALQSPRANFDEFLVGGEAEEPLVNDELMSVDDEVNELSRSDELMSVDDEANGLSRSNELPGVDDKANGPSQSDELPGVDDETTGPSRSDELPGVDDDFDWSVSERPAQAPLAKTTSPSSPRAEGSGSPSSSRGESSAASKASRGEGARSPSSSRGEGSAASKASRSEVSRAQVDGAAKTGSLEPPTATEQAFKFTGPETLIIPEPDLNPERLIKKIKAVTAAETELSNKLANAKDALARMRIVLFHAEADGWTRAERQLKLLGCEAVWGGCDVQAVLEQLRRAPEAVALIWHPGGGDPRALAVVEAILDADLAGRVGILLHVPGEPAILDARTRGMHLMYDKLAIVNWTRSRFEDDIRTTMSAMRDPEAALSRLHALRRSAHRRGDSGTSSAAYISELGQQISKGLAHPSAVLWSACAYVEWLLTSGQLPAARAEAATLLQQYPKTFSVRLVAAAVSTQAGDLKAVPAAVKWVAAGGQELPERIERLIELLFRFERYEAVREALGVAMTQETFAKDYRYGYFAGRLLTIEGRFAEAVATFEPAIDVFPGRWELLFVYAEALLKSGEAGRAAHIADECLRLPTAADISVRLLKVRCLARQRQWRQAEDALQIVLKAEPKNAAAVAMQQGLIKREVVL